MSSDLKFLKHVYCNKNCYVLILQFSIKIDLCCKFWFSFFFPCRFCLEVGCLIGRCCIFPQVRRLLGVLGRRSCGLQHLGGSGLRVVWEGSCLGSSSGFCSQGSPGKTYPSPFQQGECWGPERWWTPVPQTHICQLQLSTLGAVREGMGLQALWTVLPTILGLCSTDPSLQ